MTVTCPSCQEDYERLGTHWQWNPSHRVSLSSEQREILTGLLMGDGSISDNSKNPSIQAAMINQDYLKYLDKKFPVLGLGVSEHITAEESCQQNIESGFSPNADPKNYSDVYRWRSMNHPEFKNFHSWYDSGEKVWPGNIELTPTVLKNWYVCDGNWDNKGTTSRIRLSMANEYGNKEKINSMFENVGLPTPSRYDEQEINDKSTRFNAQFTKSASKKLWNYMGEPLPGFEYKWPDMFNGDTL